jgi:hypothetical protein
LFVLIRRVSLAARKSLMLHPSQSRLLGLSCLLVLGVAGCEKSLSIPTSPDGGSGTGTAPTGGPAHVRITVSDTLFRSIGDSLQGSARVTDAGGALIATAIPTWSVTAPDVAILGGAAGLVVARAPGTTLLIASYAGLSDTTRLTVRPVAARFAIPQPMLTLSALGATAETQVAITDARGTVIAGTPIDYISSAPAVATVGTTGVVSATGAGTAYIRLQAVGLRDSIRVTVTLPPVDVIVTSVSFATHTVSSDAVGDTLRLAATARTAAGTIVTTPISYRSLDPTVVMVGQTGAAWTVSAGTGRLVASVGTVADTAVVTVTPIPTFMRMSSATAALTTAGQTATLTATPLDRLGSPVAGAVVTWTSSAPAVASVSATGLLTAVANGTTTITATSGTVSGTAAVTVTIAPPAPASLAFVTRTGSITCLGDTLRLRTVVRDAAGAVMTTVPTYRVLETLAATVDASGLVTEAGTGTVHVVATLGTLADTATLTLTEVATRITATRTVDSLTVGDSITPGFNAYDARGNYIAVYPTLTTAPTSVARVSGTRVVAVAPGSAIVTATMNGATAQSNIVVRAAVSITALRNVTPGASATLVGRGFASATTLSVDGVAIPLPTSGSDTTIDFIMPTTQGCDVDGRPIGVRVAAGATVVTATYPLVVPTAWTLGIGESRVVSASAAPCIVLPKGAGNYRMSVVSLDRGNTTNGVFGFQTVVSHAASYSPSPIASFSLSPSAPVRRSARGDRGGASDLISGDVRPGPRTGLTLPAVPLIYAAIRSSIPATPGISRSVSGTTASTFDPRLATASVGDTIVLPDWFNKATTQFEICAMPKDSVPILKAVVYAINGSAVALLDTRLTNMPDYANPVVRARFIAALGAAEQFTLPAIHSVTDPAYATPMGAGGRHFTIVTSIPAISTLSNVIGTIWFGEGMPQSACPNASGADFTVLAVTASTMTQSTISGTIAHERSHISDQRYAWKSGLVTTTYGRQLTSSGWMVEALASTVEETASRIASGTYTGAVQDQTGSATVPQPHWGIWVYPSHDDLSPWGGTTTLNSTLGEYIQGSQYMTYARQIAGEGASVAAPSQTLFQRLALSDTWTIDALAGTVGMTGDRFLDDASLAIVTDDAVSATAAARYSLPQFTFWDNSFWQTYMDGRIQGDSPTHYWASTTAMSGTEVLAPGAFGLFTAFTDADKGQSIMLSLTSGAPPTVIRLTRIR